MAPLVLLILLLGVFPKPMLDVIEPTVAGDHAARRGHRPATAGDARKGAADERC